MEEMENADDEDAEEYMKYLIQSFPDAKKSDDFDEIPSEFITACTFLSQNYESGTYGKEIGEVGWEAIEAIYRKNGTFEKKMKKLKKVCADADIQVFDTLYDEGQYKIGKGIKSGEYVFFAYGSEGYFCVSSDANGNNIISNDNFDYNSIMTVRNGEYLELSGCYAVPIKLVKKFPKKKATMFKVGTHLSAGEYKLLADDEGYYCIYSDNRQNNISSNDNFKKQSYVKVRKGDYLLLSGCHIK